MLELELHVHRDVTLEGHEEARHLAHGHELPPGRLQVQEESQGHDHVPERLQECVCSPCARQRLPHRLGLDMEEEAIPSPHPGRVSAWRHAPY